MNEPLKFEIFSNEELVAKVTAFSSRGHDVYDFIYVPSWIEKGYPLDPTLYFTSDIRKLLRSVSIIKNSIIIYYISYYLYSYL